jgi:hypothetical protein
LAPVNNHLGCACDIPSHAYTYNFALNPDWPRFFSYSPDIWKYLDKVCETFGLRKYMNFNTQVVESRWNEEKGKWIVKIQRSKPGSDKVEEFEDDCDLLLYATGILNDFKMPNIEGIEKFKGRVCHTARWPKDYQEEQWKNDSVAVIGSGASSIQTVPKMQPVSNIPIATKLNIEYVFSTSSTWTSLSGQECGLLRLRTTLERIRNIQPKRRKSSETIQRSWLLMQRTSKIKSMDCGERFTLAPMHKLKDKKCKCWLPTSILTKANAARFRARMAEFIKDKRLLEGFTPVSSGRSTAKTHMPYSRV